MFASCCNYGTYFYHVTAPCRLVSITRCCWKRGVALDLIWKHKKKYTQYEKTMIPLDSLYFFLSNLLPSPVWSGCNRHQHNHMEQVSSQVKVIHSITCYSQWITAMHSIFLSLITTVCLRGVQRRPCKEAVGIKGPYFQTSKHMHVSAFMLTPQAFSSWWDTIISALGTTNVHTFITPWKQHFHCWVFYQGESNPPEALKKR